MVLGAASRPKVWGSTGFIVVVVVMDRLAFDLLEAGRAVDRDGVCVVNRAVDGDEVEGLREAIERRVGVVEGAAVRNVMRVVPELGAWARSAGVRVWVEELLGVGARPVRAMVFDKTMGLRNGFGRNWKVAWHQDVTIAVKERREVEGYGPWSVKEGVVHVQPPARVLERMLTLRLHLDECRLGNGAVKVRVGSHRSGVVPVEAMGTLRAALRERACECDAGGVMFMKPLVCHASGAATVMGRRRVVHVEYAVGELDGGLEWAEDGTQ